MKYLRKQMICDPSKPDEKELSDWIDSKKHGFFTNTTKAYLFELMRKEKEGDNKWSECWQHIKR